MNSHAIHFVVCFNFSELKCIKYVSRTFRVNYTILQHTKQMLIHYFEKRDCHREAFVILNFFFIRAPLLERCLSLTLQCQLTQHNVSSSCSRVQHSKNIQQIQSTQNMVHVFQLRISIVEGHQTREAPHLIQVFFGIQHNLVQAHTLTLAHT